MTYAQAIFPDVVRVAGCALVPVTIGHALLLERVGSPFCFWDEKLWEQDKSAGDLSLALFALSRPWEAARDAVGCNHKRMLLWMRWKAFRRLGEADSDVFDLAQYIVQQWKGPDILIESSAIDKSQVSPVHGLVRTLTVHMGRSLKEAMDYPIKVALWDTSAFWETRGAVRFKSPEDIARIAEVKAEQEKMRMEQANA